MVALGTQAPNDKENANNHVQEKTVSVRATCVCTMSHQMVAKTQLDMERQKCC
jgi:hypothetical protein